MATDPSSTAPKKIGSLRDRIAQFEKPAEAGGAPGKAAPPLVPRGNIGREWKPRPRSPVSPASNTNNDTVGDPSTSSGGDGNSGSGGSGKAGGMSATDAKESITRGGGSLKERMAALQGRGGFSSSPGAAPPPVPKEKPKWKPPPVIKPVDVDEEEETTAPEAEEKPSESVIENPSDSDQPVESQPAPPTVAPEIEGEGEAKEEAELDPEEAERERRAAIAARMAKLGGARIGMAPMFGGPPPVGKKPVAAPPRKKSIDEEPIAPATHQEEPISTSPEAAAVASEPIPLASTPNDSSLSPDSLPTGIKSPSMPLPQAPRRVGPPRRKAPITPKVEETPPPPPPPTEQAVVGDTEGRSDSKPLIESEALQPVPVEDELRIDDTGVPIIPAPAAEEASFPVLTAITSPPPSHEPVVTLDSGTDSVDAKEIEQISGPPTEAMFPVEAQADAPHEGNQTEDSNDGNVDEVQQETEPDRLLSPTSPPRTTELTSSNVEDEPNEEDEGEETVNDPQEPSEENVEEEEEYAAPPPPPPRFIPPPPPTVAPNPSVVEEEDPQVSSPPPRFVPPALNLPDEDEDNDGPGQDGGDKMNISVVPPTPATAALLGGQSGFEESSDDEAEIPGQVEQDGDEYEEADIIAQYSDNEPEQEEPDLQDDSQQDEPPPPPPRTAHPERVTRPPPQAPSDATMLQDNTPELDGEKDDESSVESGYSHHAAEVVQQRPTFNIVTHPPGEKEQEHQQPPPTSPPYSASSHSSSNSIEVLAEEEGDPIDPEFHVPSRQGSHSDLRASYISTAGSSALSQPLSPTSPISPTLSPTSASTTNRPLPQTEPANPIAGGEPTEQTSQEEEDAESARRRTIAERMARLGGIKFGAPPPVPGAMRPPMPARTSSNPSSGPADDGEPPVEATAGGEMTEEEEERARKARIAAKIASMGGQRIGMMPGMMPPKVSRALKEEEPTSVPAKEEETGPETEEEPAPPPPPRRASGSHPPPVPGSRKSSGQSMTSPPASYKDVAPPVPGARPPVPAGLPPNRRMSRQMSSSSSSTTTAPPPQPQQSPPQKASDYVMVDEPDEFVDVQRDLEEEEVPPPPPPSRPTKRVSSGDTHAPLPSRVIPPPPPERPTPTTAQSTSGMDWELPSIPGSDLEMSWTSDGDFMSSGSEAPVHVSSSPPPPPPPSSARPPVEAHHSADELMAIWGRVGVHIAELSGGLLDKSKKSLVGDGSYHGFVKECLSMVPSAMKPTPSNGQSYTYGQLIYVQNGTTVQQRLSDILPGDIIVLSPGSKLKGRHGLQTYSQTAGGEGETEDVAGVITEFEPKKFKAKALQANKKVGQQTVESVSYRLEDLKSGTIKVYRALEAAP